MHVHVVDMHADVSALGNCFQTIEEFHNIFGPELKAVTGDPERIDTVIQRVDRLVLDIETIKFDPFNPSNK